LGIPWAYFHDHMFVFGAKCLETLLSNSAFWRSRSVSGGAALFGMSSQRRWFRNVEECGMKRPIRAPPAVEAGRSRLVRLCSNKSLESNIDSFI
jgi:hypothetical protein